MRPANVLPKYDGNTRNGLALYEERIYIWHLYHGICQGCGMPLDFGEMEIAHCIANTKANKRRYGKRVINSLANKRPTHRGKCNSRCNCAGKPDKCAEIVAQAETEARREG